MNLDKKNHVLVTGGAGFVGSHLCERLVTEGYKVICLDNFSTGSQGNLVNLISDNNFQLVEGDVTNETLLRKLCKDVDIVFHLAAQGHVEVGRKDVHRTIDTNVTGTFNVLEAVRAESVTRMIHASSSEVYGSAEFVPMNESHPLNAPHAYGVSKVAADRACFSYRQSYGMNVEILRFFNIFGPRQDSGQYGAVIPMFTKAVSNGISPIINGDGSQSRDYIFIDDSIDAYLTVLKSNKPLVMPLNFCTGIDVTIAEIATEIIKRLGKEDKISPSFSKPRIGEVDRLIGDKSTAIDLLGWKAKYLFTEGLDLYLDWYCALDKSHSE